MLTFLKAEGSPCAPNTNLLYYQCSYDLHQIPCQARKEEREERGRREEAEGREGEGESGREGES